MTDRKHETFTPEPPEAAPAPETVKASASAAAPGTPSEQKTIPNPEIPAGNSFPNVVDFLVFFGIFLVGQVAGIFAALLSGLTFPDYKLFESADESVRAAEQLSAAQFNAVTYLIAMAITLGGALLYRRLRGVRGKIGHFSAAGFNPVILLWGLVLMFACSVVFEPVLSMLPDVPNVYGSGAWALLTVVVMAPLFEEVIFRGVIFESVRAKRGVVAAWIISSVVFGIVHVHPTIAVNAVIAGFLLGFIYTATRSLWATIILHAVNNGIAYLMMISGNSSTTLDEMVGNNTVYALIYIVALAVLVVSGYMIIRKMQAMDAGDKNVRPA